TLGLIARAQGRVGEARVHLERALRLSPNDVPTLIALGDTYLAANEPGLAGAAYQRALGLDPGSAVARAGLGWVALVIGRPEGAARLWRDVIDATRDGATLVRMADVFHALGDRESEARARAALARLGGAR